MLLKCKFFGFTISVSKFQCTLFNCYRKMANRVDGHGDIGSVMAERLRAPDSSTGV